MSQQVKGNTTMMKNYLLSAWHIVDPIYYLFTRLQYVLDHENEKTIFRVRLTRYKGSPVTLQDGTEIKRNDLLLKIHLHNVRILTELHSIRSELKRAVLIYHLVKRALPRLAYYVQTHNRYHDIKGIIGITSLFRSADRLGFEMMPIHNTFYRHYKKNTFIFIQLLANNTISNDPVYLFMSKGELIKKYTSKKSSGSHAPY